MKPHSYSNKRRNTGVKAQSAMEYLMTYGWAILIIAVVIGVLFQMGVFSSTGSLGNSCLAQSGFLCSNPVLNSAGDLAISFGQFTGDKITITQIGCSSSTAEPTMHGTSIVLQNGQTNTETFSCPVPSSALGTQFTGTLWVTYTNTKGQSEVVEFATIAAKITQIGSAGATVIAYVPITITNSQTSPTPAPFQQQLIVDSASFTDINSNWQNVEFTTGPDGTGTLLNAWVETNPSNTATSTEVWVNLPTAIAGSGSQTIYMDMMSASIMSSLGPTGEAPQLSISNGGYGALDDGSSVFNFYDNFMGSTLDSNWQQNQVAGSPSYYTVSNGLTLTGCGGSCAINIGSSSEHPITDIFENDYASQSGDYAFSIYYANDQYGGPYTSACLACPGTGTGTGYDGLWIVDRDSDVFSAYQGAYTNPGLGQAMPAVYGVSVQSGTSYYFVNEPSAPTLTVTSDVPPTGNYYMGMVAGFGGTWVLIQWSRTRAFPPNGVMPGVSFGSEVIV